VQRPNLLKGDLGEGESAFVLVAGHGHQRSLRSR
jgi:hypothetical protein